MLELLICELFVHDLPQIWDFSIVHVTWIIYMQMACLPPKNTHAASWEGPTEAVITQQIAANVTALP